LTAAVAKHNEAFASFASMQKDAFAKIEAHVLATNQDEWNALQADLQTADADLKAAQTEERRLTDRQLELRNDLQDHGVGADKMNDLIWAYLGHKELRLVAEDGGYKLLRPNGETATELSEGERTAVSFCYFLTQLAAEGRKTQELVLVIDDPISSLDTAARTYAYSLMTRITKKCAQVIVLTHNTSFMNMVICGCASVIETYSRPDALALRSQARKLVSRGAAQRRGSFLEGPVSRPDRRRPGHTARDGNKGSKRIWWKRKELVRRIDTSLVRRLIGLTLHFATGPRGKMLRVHCARKGLPCDRATGPARGPCVHSSSGYRRSPDG